MQQLQEKPKVIWDFPTFESGPSTEVFPLPDVKLPTTTAHDNQLLEVNTTTAHNHEPFVLPNILVDPIPTEVGANIFTASYGDTFGKMGKYVQSSGISVDWSIFANHGSGRLKERGITQDMINNWVQNGKALEQNEGKNMHSLILKV